MLRECHVDHPPLTTTRGARDDDEQLGEVEEPQRPTERSEDVDIEVFKRILKFAREIGVFFGQTSISS